MLLLMLTLCLKSISLKFPIYIHVLSFYYHHVIDTEDKTAAVADDDGSDFMDAGGAGSSSSTNGIITGSSATQQSLSWRAHKVDSWYEMCDATLQDM